MSAIWFQYYPSAIKTENVKMVYEAFFSFQYYPSAIKTCPSVFIIYIPNMFQYYPSAIKTGYKWLFGIIAPLVSILP